MPDPTPHRALTFRDNAGRQWHTVITGREVLHLERLLRIKVLDLIDTDSVESKRLSYADRLELILELIRPQMERMVWRKPIEKRLKGHDKPVVRFKRTRGVTDWEFLESLDSDKVRDAWVALYAGLVNFAQPSRETLDNLERATRFVQTAIHEHRDQAEERMQTVLEKAVGEVSTTGCSPSSGSTAPSAESSPGPTPSESFRITPSSQPGSLEPVSPS